MTIAVGIAKSDSGRKFSIGDKLALEILIDEKVGAPGDAWRFTDQAPWVVSGDFVVDTKSLEAVASDGVFTKLSFKAIVHKDGHAGLGKLAVEHVPSGKTFEASGALLENVEKIQLSQEEAQGSWLLPTIPISELSYISIALATILVLAILSAVTIAVYRYWKKKRGLKLYSPEATALDAIKKLEALAKSSSKSKDWKKFSYQLADVIKRYSDVKLGVDTRDLTDRELLQLIELQKGGSDFTNFLSRILSDLNEARYGTKPLDLEHAKAMLTHSREFIGKIKAREEAEAQK